MPSVAGIWRHPIKAHGREQLSKTNLETGRTMPGDRVWAVAHEASKADNEAWSHCAGFSRGAKVLGLQAITCTLDEASGRLSLRHPEIPDITFDPLTQTGDFIDWVRPLMPENRAQSTRLVRVPGRGMTDTEFPSISLLNLASHKAVEELAGQALSPLRWRGNFLMEGLSAWEEFNWVGKTIRIGQAEIEIREPITRCNATRADPATGKHDVDTLALLDQGWGHQEFGVCGVVTKPGRVRAGDAIEVLS